MPIEFSMDPARQQLIPIPDGRVVAVAEFGPADGIPLISFAGAASSRAMNAHGDAAERRRIRTITFDRPGLGESTFDPDKSLSTVAADLAIVLGRLGVERPIALANSQGAPFALAAAADGLLSRLALVSPADELTHPDVRRQLTGETARFVDQIADDPDGMRALLTGYDAPGMFDFVLSGAASSDVAVFGDAQFRDLFRRSLEQGFAQGGAGYAQDTVIATSPWDIDVRAVGDVQVWFGADDMAHSPDLGATLANRLGADRHVIDGVGGSLLWTHTAGILDELLAP